MNRPEYTGEDTVGAVDADSLVGTWQVAVVNKAEIEPGIDVVMRLNSDGSFGADAKYDFGGLGKYDLDIAGTWVVDDEMVTLITESVEETSGNLPPDSGDDIYDGEPDLFNIYEVASDSLVMFEEAHGVAYSYTRLK